MVARIVQRQNGGAPMSPQATIMLRLIESGQIVTIPDARAAGVKSPVQAVAELITDGVKIRADFRRGQCVWMAAKHPITREQQEALEARAHNGVSKNASLMRHGRMIWRLVADGSWWSIDALVEKTTLNYDLVRASIQRFRSSSPVRYAVNTRPVEGNHRKREYQIIRLGER
mgnify:CR=1 FL=1